MSCPSTPRASRPARPILHAELLAIGTELTVGETVDTNSGDLARSLVAHGVAVTRIASLPDDLATVVDAMRTALGRADLVVTTGGLGPTPDDLTREAVAAVCGETVTVDPDALAWLRAMWARRGQPFPSTNVKQAWIIPSATPLPNPHGTAPGWWVDRPDGRVIVNLPGPPREMRPMWSDTVLPRLAVRGVGGDTEVRTLRLFGIGESQVAERLGEPSAPGHQPDRRHVRPPRGGGRARLGAGRRRGGARPSSPTRRSRRSSRSSASSCGPAATRPGPVRWTRPSPTRGWTLATTETGTGGALITLLRGMSAMRRAEVLAGEMGPGAPEPTSDGEPELREAERVRAEA